MQHAPWIQPADREHTSFSRSSCARGSLTCVPSLAAAAATAAAAAKARKVGLGVEDREREGEEGEEGDTYLDGHVETNMATSSKDRYTFRT